MVHMSMLQPEPRHSKDHDAAFIDEGALSSMASKKLSPEKLIERETDKLVTQLRRRSVH